MKFRVDHGRKLAVIFFYFEDKHYLVCVDYYLDYFEVDRIFGKKGKEVISRIKSQFARHGIPDQLISDNGPPFSSREFPEFALAYEFEHLTSSPRYPQSNGKVENAVKMAQNMIKKARLAGKDPNLPLLDYRNTPSEGLGSSPAQRLFSRKTKTLIPTSSKLLVPEAAHGVPHKLKERRAKQAFYYDRVAKELDRLKPGDVVHVKLSPDSKEWTKAAVDKEVDIRSYQVRTEDGRIYRRNRRYLKHTREPFLTAPFVGFSANLSQQQQREGVARGDVSVSGAPTSEPALEASNRKPTSDVPNSSSVVQPQTTTVRTNRSGGVVSVPASGVSTSEPAVSVTTTRSGRVVGKPIRYDS